MRSLLCLAIACGCGSSSPPVHSPGTLPAAIEAANAAHQPLVVEFGATWCKPCHAFAEHVLTDPRVQAALRDVAFVQYDIDTPAGNDAIHRCGVTGVPAIVGVDHDGAVRIMKAGAEPTVDEFLGFLRDAKR